MTLSVEGITQIIGFAVTIGGFWYGYGRLTEKADRTERDMTKLDKDTSEKSDKLYNCIEATNRDVGQINIKVGKIEEHLKTLNGSVARNTADIGALEDRERRR